MIRIINEDVENNFKYDPEGVMSLSEYIEYLKEDYSEDDDYEEISEELDQEIKSLTDLLGDNGPVVVVNKSFYELSDNLFINDFINNACKSIRQSESGRLYKTGYGVKFVDSEGELTSGNCFIRELDLTNFFKELSRF